jgi:type 1 glutamine amidotransferase
MNVSRLQHVIDNGKCDRRDTAVKMKRQHSGTTTMFFGLLIAGITAFSLAAPAAQPKRLLVVSVTKGFRHGSIPTGEMVLAKLARQSGAFTLEFLRGGEGDKNDAEVRQKMAPVSLAAYDGVIFNNTSGDLAIPDKEHFVNWVKSGKAFIGLHAASDTLHSFAPYLDMVGAEFLTHHQQVGVECLNQDPAHPANQHLDGTFAVFDEIYLFKNFHRDRVHGLLWLDKHPNFGYPGDFPISWCKDFGQGRVFYTALGHRDDVWDDSPNLNDRKNPPEVARAFQQHLLGGIMWALGLAPGSGEPQDFAYSVSSEEAAEGFVPLFNGKDLTGWHLRRPDGVASWSAQNGMLVNTLPGEDEHGTDLVTDEKFWNFTVRYEYMVPKGSNSGFYLRGRYEVQILDDYEAGRTDAAGNGSLYSYAKASQFVSRPAGEWQTAEATIVGDRVTVTLNGVQIIDNVAVARPTGGELDRNIKDPGAIFLQGDHGAVAFRNLRIKKLPLAGR